MTRRQKIAILGGGTGALSAAFGLTERPDWRRHYSITVYALGWRLGGKGASGRNAQCQQRIEEHGLHVWAGFYENAFRMMRQCYDELRRPADAPLTTWQDAFKPHSFVTFEELHQGRWLHWNVEFPSNGGVPGDGKAVPGFWRLVQMTLRWLWDYVQRSLRRLAPIRASVQRPALRSAPRRAGHLDMPDWVARVVHEADVGLRRRPRTRGLTLPKPTTRGLPTVALQWIDYARDALKVAWYLPDEPARHRPSHRDAILWLLRQFLTRLFGAVRSRIERNHDLRRLWMLLDFVLANVRGVLADGVLIDGFDSIDDWEWTDWLRKHGASELTLQSPLVRAIYEYIFAFERGDTSRPRVAAGTCVRGLARLALSYKGAIFWEMQAGMGEVVFAPLYQVLKRRGVRFKFFHRVKNLGLSTDQQSIDSITVGRQVTLTRRDYQPLIDVKGLPCWPSEPQWDQIIDQEADQLRRTHAAGIDLESAWTSWHDREEIVLRRGKDFDTVVLGIPLGVLPHICSELIDARRAWKDMVEKVQTVQTQALQLWLAPDTKALGWDHEKTILTAYAQPLATWADLSHLIEQEHWPQREMPGHIAYLCGPLHELEAQPPFTETQFPEQERERVRKIAVQWLKSQSDHLWPQRATQSPAASFDWQRLVDPRTGSGEARFRSQYWRANINPSDRYVLSVPHSTQYRLRADGSGFENLFLAGDWVYTPINAGCIEAAVIAGLQASRAICGYPQVVFGEDGAAESKNSGP